MKMDWIDVGSQIVGALGVLIAAVSLAISAETRTDDLRWRQAEAARDALADIHRSPAASRALELLDCHIDGHPLQLVRPNGEVLLVDLKAACDAAMNRAPDPWLHDEVSRWLDWFLYYMDRSGFMLSKGFFSFEDLRGPFLPYAQPLLDHRPCVERIATAHNYEHALQLLERISQSRAAAPVA